MRNDAFILGHGMVGKATALALQIPDWFDLKGSTITLSEGAKRKWCFICLPTPTDSKGSQDKAIEVIRNYIKEIQEYGNPIFIVRSTVLPGTCRALATMTGAVVVSNPEFLSEATWDEDAIHPRMKVIGADDVAIRRGVVDLWRPVESKIDIATDTVTSETIKYVFNTFAALKVVYANQIYDNCVETGADYEVVREALHRHPWGSKHHFKVTDKGGRGAGGRCLPKDLKAFTLFTGSELLKMTDKLNSKYLTESHKE